jgi:exonuclease SbcD
MTVKFLHFADVHLGVENYGRIDPTTGLHTRVQDFVRCLRFVCETAIREHVDFAVFAGDAYKTCDPSPTHQREFAAQMRLLNGAGIPLVMVTGNHDNPAAFGKASSIDIFGTLNIRNIYVLNKPKLFTLETRSGPVQIACLPWPTRGTLMAKDEYKDLSDEQMRSRIEGICTDIITRFAEQIDPEVPAILVAHITAAGAVYSSERLATIGKDPVLTTGTLAHPAFDYVALGHIHKFQDLNPNGHPPVVYAGSVERVDFGEEKEEKGFCIVTINDLSEEGREDTDNALPLFSDRHPQKRRRETTYRFLHTPARPFVTIRVSAGEGEEVGEAITKAIKKHDLNEAITRVIYTVGEGQPVSLDLKDVHHALQDAFLVSSITPKVDVTPRLRRAGIAEDMGLRESLSRYIENHPELGHLSDELQEYALRIEMELERELGKRE